MALLDRVKERTKSTLSDAELQLLIDEANAEVIRRHGEHADPALPLTVLEDGGFKSIVLSRPASTIDEITETVGVTETVLAADDFQLRNGGHRIERLSSGTNPRHSWGRLVEITYDPIDDGNQRQEVIVKLVALSLDYDGVKSESVDGYASSRLDYEAEREKLLASLGPRVLLG